MKKSKKIGLTLNKRAVSQLNRKDVTGGLATTSTRTSPGYMYTCGCGDYSEICDLSNNGCISIPGVKNCKIE